MVFTHKLPSLLVIKPASVRFELPGNYKGEVGISSTNDYKVKNTFIHFDLGDEEEEQPSMFNSKSRSGPPCFGYVGEGFHMTAGLSDSREESDDAISKSSPLAEVDSFPSDRMKLEDALPSVGSSRHVHGDCKPCAHYCRPGGCSKGTSCSFCHLCEDGAARAWKKEKVARTRKERRQQVFAALR